MVGGAGPLPSGAERLELTTHDGERLHGVHIRPGNPPRQAAPVVLGFAGNAWNAEDAALHLSDLYPAAQVVLFHYRGYAPSTGTPGAKALLADSLLIHDFVKARLKPEKIVIAGFSIGSGVAAHLASRRDVAGVILVTPFDSLRAVAQGHYPWLPVGPLFKHRMEPAEDLARTSAPVALIAAERDTLIPPRRTEPLRKAARNLVLNRVIAGVGHNDIYQHPDYRFAMLEALQLMAKQR